MVKEQAQHDGKNMMGQTGQVQQERDNLMNEVT
jgi:hypothetical protein